jgi:hypothetical protein
MADKIDMREKFSQGWIHVNIIIEILGKPASHIEEVIRMAVEKLGEEKGVEILNKEIHPANKIEDTTEVFTVFTEVELLVHGLPKIVDIVFNYMPASIEIVNPPTMNFKLEDANTLLNDIAMRMHQYDAISKKFRIERDYFAGKLAEMKKSEESKEKKEEN